MPGDRRRGDLGPDRSDEPDRSDGRAPVDRANTERARAAPQRDEGGGGGGALTGIRVVDLTTILMGPLAARILGDLGADVVRVESPTGDSTRNSRPARNPGMSGVSLNLHRNKRSVALDLKHPTGRRALDALVGWADVLITNMRRSALERLELSPEVVCADHPGLIYCIGNGFGSDGPYAQRPAYDDVIQAGSGLAWLIGRTQDRPAYLPAILADKVCGMTIAQAVLAALVHRLRTGEGQVVEVPMLEVMTAFNLTEHLRGQVFEPPEGPFGYERLLTRFRRPYRSRDGWVAILPYTDAHWQAFFRLAGRDDLASDPRVVDHNTRTAHIDELYRLVDELTPARTTEEWVTACEAASIPATAVMDLSRFEDDPHLAAVGLAELAEHPTEGSYRHVRDPVRYERSPTGLHPFAPRLGEHTREALREAGWTDDQISAALAEGAAREPDPGDGPG